MHLRAQQKQETNNHVLEFLTEHGLLEQNKSDGSEASYPISMGIDKVRYQVNYGLLLDMWRVIPTPRHLSQISRKWETPSRGAYLHQTQYLAELYLTGNYDPVLYNAYRDIFPPRSKHAYHTENYHSTLPQASYWYADLIEYLPGMLPTGELFRSTGHWNSEQEIEIFEVLLGKVCIITAGSTLERQRYLDKQVYSPGDLCVIPPGAWHLTYVLDGPALVFNIYTEHTGTDNEVRNWLAKKYEWRSPLEICLVNKEQPEAGPQLIFSKKARRSWQGVSSEPLRTFQQFILKDCHLPDLFLFSPLDRLNQLEEDILHQWALKHVE